MSSRGNTFFRIFFHRRSVLSLYLLKTSQNKFAKICYAKVYGKLKFVQNEI